MNIEIARSAYEHQRKVESGDKIIVGVNKFTADEKNSIPPFKIDDTIRLIQTEKLNSLRATRNGNVVADRLSKIKNAALDGTNLMPFVIEAVENHCTLGEISDVLREVFGEYK